MPAWLMPPQILLLAAPIAMTLAALALAAGERRAQARRARDTLGKPRERVEDGAVGERVVLEGRLHVLEDACLRFEDGREAAAATVESAGPRARSTLSLSLGPLPARYPARRALPFSMETEGGSIAAGPGSAQALPDARALDRDASRDLRLAHSTRAGVLVLTCGKEDLLVEGPVEVAVGSDETDPAAPFHTLTASVRERIAKVTSGAALPESGADDPVHAMPLFRSVRSGAWVRAAGVLSKASDGARAGYREQARWVLSGKDDAPVRLAYEGTPRHHGSTVALARGVRRFSWSRAAMVLTALVTLAGGVAFGIGRPPRRPQRADRTASQPRPAPRPRATTPSPAAAFVEQRDALAAAIDARCSEPRPTAMPAKWRCVGEPESFTMYLPPETECASPRFDLGCLGGYAGNGFKIKPHFDTGEVHLDVVDRSGAFLDIQGSPARAVRTPHSITLVFEEEGAGVPSQKLGLAQDPRLAFEVECDSEQACRRAWLALQSVRVW